ncbi:MAG TPA: type II secretion system F family protein [Aliidongia sp.]|nr:type II secretion system F family protein [Aliidongia sp.]
MTSIAPLLSPLTLAFALLVAVAAVAILVLTRNTGRRVSERLAGLKPEVASESALAAGGKKISALGQMLAATPLVGSNETAKIAATLADAGILGHQKVGIFIAIKATLAFSLSVGGWFGLEEVGMLPQALAMRVAVEVMFALLGWRLPDVIVGRIAAHRRDLLRIGIADALDLMVICVETGLGLEQALERVSRDIAAANPVVSAELAKTVAEIRVLPQVRDAFDNFARRSKLPAVRSVMTTLVQTIQYGTPLAQSLRVLSADMRMRRILEVEERAARLPVLLTIPLIIFILPCLFLVVGGPAALQVLASLKG